MSSKVGAARVTMCGRVATMTVLSKEQLCICLHVDRPGGLFRLFHVFTISAQSYSTTLA